MINLLISLTYFCYYVGMVDVIKSEQNQAYRAGVLKTSDVPVVFLDPDLFDMSDLPAAGEELTRQLEAQAPGITKALLDKIKESGDERNGITNTQVTPHQLAYLFSKRGPSAVSNIMVGGKEYCVVNEPDHRFDNKDEITTFLSRHKVDSEFIPGDDDDWNRIVGLHEGEHCNQEEGEVQPRALDNALDVLNEELRADRSALSLSDAEVALAYKDLRHLSSSVFLKNWRNGLHDGAHATGALLNGDDQAEKHHFEASSSYKQRIDDFVGENAAEILEDDPNAYFESVNSSLENHMVEQYGKYLENPSFEEIETFIAEQAMADYAKSYEGAYRRRIMGEDVPDEKPTQYIPDGLKERYTELNNAQPKEDALSCSTTGIVTAEGGLNIRYNAGIEFDKLVADQDGNPSNLNFGDHLTIHGEAKGKLGEVWKVAVTEDGRQGYVNMDYVDEGPEICVKPSTPIQNAF